MFSPRLRHPVIGFLADRRDLTRLIERTAFPSWPPFFSVEKSYNFSYLAALELSFPVYAIHVTPSVLHVFKARSGRLAIALRVFFGTLSVLCFVGTPFFRRAGHSSSFFFLEEFVVYSSSSSSRALNSTSARTRRMIFLLRVPSL